LWLPLQFNGNHPIVEWIQSWDLSFFQRNPGSRNPPPPPRKKRVGFWNGNDKANQLSDKVDALGCGWYYILGAAPDPKAKAIQAEFIPMIWSAKEATEDNLRRVKESASGVLLGFNEPDVKDQSNMTVDQALELWPKLMATGLRLGSSAPGAAVDSGWLPQFMRVDKR
jgi:hypothetical protein